MSTSTTNYGLVKPAGGEQYARSVLNNNYDLIDAAIMAEAHKIQHIEIVRQGHTGITANSITGLGDMSTLVESASSKNYSDWITFPSADMFRLTKEGIYSISWKIVPNSTTTIWHSASDSAGNMAGGVYGRSYTSNVVASDGFWMAGGNDVYIPPAGADVYMKFAIGTSVTINHRIKVTKIK